MASAAMVCNVCGAPCADNHCTNGRCIRCHATHCTAGGATAPGHQPIKPANSNPAAEHRGRFERWMARHWPDVSLESAGAGRYTSMAAQAAWEVWQHFVVQRTGR